MAIKERGMITLAFLQNTWSKDPERVRKHIERHGDKYRKRLVYYALFGSGSLTGRRLKTAFGEESIKDIVWEEASPEVGSHSGSWFPPDLPHIRRIIQEEKPDVILTFGRIAGEGLSQVETAGVPVISGPHPTARMKDVAGKLREVAACWEAHLLTQGW